MTELTSLVWRVWRQSIEEEVPQTPVQGSGAHDPLLSREATSHSLTAMLVWFCRLKMWTQKVLHVRSAETGKATVRCDYMPLLGVRVNVLALDAGWQKKTYCFTESQFFFSKEEKRQTRAGKSVPSREKPLHETDSETTAEE